MIKKLIKNKIVKNASWLMAGSLVQMLMSFIIGLITARYLGPSNYGLIYYAAGYTSFFAAFVNLGLESGILVKEFIDDKEKEGEVLGTVIGMKLASALLSSLIIMIIVFIVDYDEPTTKLVVFLSCVGLVFQVFTTVKYRFQAELQSKVVAVVTFIAYLITTVYKVYLLVSDKSVEWFAFATALDCICLGIMFLWCYFKSGGKRLSFSIDRGRKLLGVSKYYILLSVFVGIYSYSDKLMLKQLLDETQVGYYTTATGICAMWVFVITAIIDSLTPSIIESYSQNYERYEYNNILLYSIIFYVSAAASIFLVIFSPILVPLLYGNAYLPAVTPLRVVTWMTAFSYFGVARGTWLICENLQRYVIRIYAVSAVANIVLNYLLIPGMGATGAAIATLATQIMTVLVVPFFVPQIRKSSILMLKGMNPLFLIKEIRAIKSNQM